MKLVSTFLDWLDDFIDRRRVDQAAHYWYAQGAISPYAAAEHERILRLKLEEFRTFASRRYLEDQSLTRDQIKQEWLDLVVKPMSRSEFARDDAKALRAAVQVMGDEMFLGAAKRARRTELQRAVSSAHSLSEGLRRSTRQQAMRLR
jgi:hypothetical protein